jgi:NADH-quinone oxidoreductase subunit D
MTFDPTTAMHLSDATVSIELETPDMTINIGPQHPSTHGVLRLVAQIEGERVKSIQPAIGYMHRGYEKLSEVRTYPQITTLVNRIDWVSGFANEVPFIVAVEKLMEVEAPPRAQYIRLILAELFRISNHLVFMSSLPLEVGATTPLMHAMRDRENILDLIEGVTGGRFHPNFNRIGGIKPAAGGGPTQKTVSQDIPVEFFRNVMATMDRVDSICDDIDGLVTGNEIFLARTKGVGIIPLEKAAEHGVSGPNLRASGTDFDLRRKSDYLPYGDFDWDVQSGSVGDVFDRFTVRVGEVRQAARIVRQAIEGIPSGPLRAKVPRVIKVPPGEVYVRAENPKGEMGYYVVSEGGKGPYRLKIRSASFSNISILSWLLEGVLVPDLIAIMGSLDFVLGDVDR